jgi:hypothetical protein
VLTLAVQADDYPPSSSVLAGGIATLDEIESAARRLIALRNWDVTGGAKRQSSLAQSIDRIGLGNLQDAELLQTLASESGGIYQSL